MKCRECGAEFDEHSVYCPKCGERTDVTPDLDEAPPSPVADEAPPSPVADEAPPSRVADEAPPAEEHVGSLEEVPGGETATPEGEGQGTVSDRLRDTAKLHHNSPDDPSMKPANPWTEGGYSGKALRGHFILACVITLGFLAFGFWLSFTDNMPADVWAKIVCGGLALVPTVAWCWLGCIYIYRVWTIKYRLATYRFYHEEGIFRRTKDVIEVIDIDDIKLERTLWDRVINGGVGTVIIKSSDSSNPILVLRGLEEPERVFESIDEVRRKQRVERGLKAI